MQQTPCKLYRGRQYYNNCYELCKQFLKLRNNTLLNIMLDFWEGANQYANFY